MTHNEARTSWFKDGVLGLSTGILYGTTSVLVGQPFDSVKTKMQAQTGFTDSKAGGMTKSFQRVIQNEGFLGLYKGSLAPLLGSGLYRATQFAVYEALYTKFDNPSLTAPIPHTGGLSSRVLFSALLASTARAALENPIEVIKVKRQTGQSWKVQELYKGFSLQWARTTGVMGTYFICIDTIRRKSPETLKSPIGQFLASSCSATLGFWLVWPLEVLKNQVQADFPMKTNEMGKDGKPLISSSPTLRARLSFLYGQFGFRGLYRGIWPGTIRSMLSNGFAMIVMGAANKKITELGWRK